MTMKNLLLITLLFASFKCFAFWGGKSEMQSNVEIDASQVEKFIPGDVVKPVWKESKSNDSLVKYTVKVFIVGLTDKYGNRKKVHFANIVFDKKMISEIRKYKWIHNFDNKSNPIHRFIIRELKNV